MSYQQIQRFQCANGVRVTRAPETLDYAAGINQLVRELDTSPGVMLASSFEYPGRYTRWDIGFSNPPLRLSGCQRKLTLEALNTRGKILLPEFARVLDSDCRDFTVSSSESSISIGIPEPGELLVEEARSRQPGYFSVLRQFLQAFNCREGTYLGFYGAFGYDLAFQFEDVHRYQKRTPGDRDLVLYFPDQVTVVDHRAQRAIRYSYDFVCRGAGSDRFSETTGGFRRSGPQWEFEKCDHAGSECDHQPGEYAAQVRRAKEYFARGDLFEVVPGQTFREPCKDSPSVIFNRLRQANPAPYGALMNLGEGEYLVAASPEMFVRVDGSRIETCPISGTIKRGEDALEDARQIRTLLNSSKDESELSMCTDVDRNDKARVCKPGSVRVIGRRQIEMYSRLIHTVDHVEGQLEQQFDALDGFLAHTWAVTVTGAPKHAAMQYIEKYEKSPRRWYGGAIGQLGLDGNINTGLTLRTIRIKDGIAEIRAGATLLMDSDPDEEEAETRLKASALVDAVRGTGQFNPEQAEGAVEQDSVPRGLSALMVDHQDSFVHNLAAYFRATGVDVVTMRPANARCRLQQAPPDLVILSPGPGRPDDYAMRDTIDEAIRRNIPIFGVCLGLQGIAEYFGGGLRQLDYPMHGKPSEVSHSDSELFSGIPATFTAGRYHSLVVSSLPKTLRVTANSEDGKVMALEHESLPVKALQFHPESIMTMTGGAGKRLIFNAIVSLCGRHRQGQEGREPGEKADIERVSAEKLAAEG